MPVLSADQGAPARVWKAITPHDTTNLPGGCRAVYVGGAGNIAMVDCEDTAVTFTGVLAGQILPCSPKRVNATLTTATLLVGLY
jgi:hypothetical protein